MTRSDEAHGGRLEARRPAHARSRAAVRRTARLAALVLLLVSQAPAASADGRKPGSLLVFPIHRGGGIGFTSISVTNTNLQPAIGATLGGATNVHFEYVHVLPDPTSPFKPLDCVITDRTEHLTPGDTTTRMTVCHAPPVSDRGYLVAVAEDPLLQPSAWSHDYLVGSEVLITPTGGAYALNAISFRSMQPERTATDRDGDGEYDLDGIEYEGSPDDLIIDSFVAADSSCLVLLNATGGTAFDATVRFEAWNDNELPLSALLTFRCWFEEPLNEVSLVFDADFLANNTPDDPTELDTNCDGSDDIQTGWARIRGLQASSSGQSIPDPAVLGAMTPGNENLLDTAKLLWESPERQTNGDFFKLGTVDPEFPE